MEIYCWSGERVKNYHKISNYEYLPHFSCFEYFELHSCQENAEVNKAHDFVNQNSGLNSEHSLKQEKPKEISE